MEELDENKSGYSFSIHARKLPRKSIRRHNQTSFHLATNVLSSFFSAVPRSSACFPTLLIFIAPNIPLCDMQKAMRQSIPSLKILRRQRFISGEPSLFQKSSSILHICFVGRFRDSLVFVLPYLISNLLPNLKLASKIRARFNSLL